ncbi:MAG: hypothetical protein QG549_447 [Patescibacteria group bacterium]|nr:hypothetical protein [Patescibacteria group bacterium]
MNSGNYLLPISTSTVGLIESLLNIDESGSLISAVIGFAVFTFTLWLDGLPMMAFATKYANITLMDAISMIVAMSFFFMVLPPCHEALVIVQADSNRHLPPSLLPLMADPQQ